MTEQKSANSACETLEIVIKGETGRRLPGPSDDMFSETATFHDRIEYFFEESLGTDVKFVVGSGENQAIILAHKIILAGSCQVFYSMFFGSLESHINHEIIIPDCDPKAFKLFIRMLYTNRNPIILEDKISDLFYISRKYLFKPLETECIKYCREKINPEIVLTILELAELYMIPELTELCWDFIEENTLGVLDSQMEKISLDLLCTILKNDKLFIWEVDLFNFVIRWAKFNCVKNGYEPIAENYKLVAESAFKLIRYPTMKSVEIVDHVVPSNILEPVQIVSLFTHIHGTSYDSENFEFNSKPRFWPNKQQEDLNKLKTSLLKAQKANLTSSNLSRSEFRRIHSSTNNPLLTWIKENRNNL